MSYNPGDVVYIHYKDPPEVVEATITINNNKGSYELRIKKENGSLGSFYYRSHDEIFKTENDATRALPSGPNAKKDKFQRGDVAYIIRRKGKKLRIFKTRIVKKWAEDSSYQVRYSGMNNPYVDMDSEEASRLFKTKGEADAYFAKTLSTQPNYVKAASGNGGLPPSNNDDNNSEPAPQPAGGAGPATRRTRRGLQRRRRSSRRPSSNRRR